jgi:Domain of unknown function (DUF4337)
MKQDAHCVHNRFFSLYYAKGIMSDEFELRGPHDDALEEAGHGHAGGGHGASPDPFAGRVAVMTAILATLGAFYTYQGGSTEGLAIFYKNEAAIRKTEAADQWNYYQAEGQKQNLAQLGATLTVNDPKANAKFAADIAKYTQRKEPIRARAEALEKSVLEADAESERQLHKHHRWAQATTLTQVAISLAAITLLTRRRWLLYSALGVAGIGVVVGAAAGMGF